jgi:TonB family protein
MNGLAIGASIALHAAIGGVFSWLALRTLSEPAQRVSPVVSADDKPPEGSGPISIELPTVELSTAGDLLDEERVDLTGEPPRVTAGDSVARLDTGSAGRGGETRTSAPALNLADRDERMRLSPDLLNRLDRDQLQRLRVARVRQSWEDRRSTTHPAKLSLVVTGAGSLIERRPKSSTDPSRGALQSPSARARGAAPGAPEAPDLEDGRRTGAGHVGSPRAAPGVGVASARAGTDHRLAAAVGSARPDVARAAVAVPSVDPARPEDNVDSAQEVATTVRSLVHASTAGGAPGEGQGGGGAGGEPGAGGTSGAGARATPLGLGEGEVFDYWTTDPRLLPYFRKMRARIDPLWANAFPKSALLDLKQGTVILDFTVFADGRVVVAWPPVRPSGIEEFDRNCADAVRRAGPLPPIPRELLGRGVDSLRVRAPFVASNPVVK